MNKFFTTKDNFENIIESVLGDVDEVSLIATGWTNFVYKVRKGNNRYIFRFPRNTFFSNVLDKEHFTLGVLNDTVENTIFWDVLNDIIVVKGKDNLKQLWIELEWMGYAKYGLDYKGERKVNFILNQKNPSRVLDKVKRMNNI